MSDVAIRVEGLGKRYRIGRRERYRTLRDTLTERAAAPFRRLRSLCGFSASAVTAEPTDLIWALKDVSFDVPQGALLGVIGRNGAGKSTLLKVLSRITEPTEGRVEILGRVGSLLEVGTGFHHELTGRENIFLNGAILGMKKAEIVRKFDEIVAFAEVEKFIDTPVKHYSSGMYVRLAFAVAAHLEPQIVVVDEVLAVGDAQFQSKCLGKMGDVAKEGRTVVLVTHQMNQVRRLCRRAIWLENGQVRSGGDINDVVSAYEMFVSRGCQDFVSPDRQNPKARFLTWDIVEPTSGKLHTVSSHDPLRIRFRLHVNRPLSSAFHGIALYSSDGQLLWGHGTEGLEFRVGIHHIVYDLSTLPLKPGAYHWLVSLYDEGGVVDEWECVPHLLVATQPSNHAVDRWAGLLNPSFEISLVSEDERSVGAGVSCAVCP